MIIDLILERKDGVGYKASEFYHDVMEYGEIGFDIAGAMDNGKEQDIKQALCHYIDHNEYNPSIKQYINSVEWL